jgi:hypothetical protein
MNFSPHSRSKSRNSFIALLLQPTLHNFGALAPINPLDRITYRPNGRKSRKSNAALLLPHVFPVSPLLHCSYKKMGVSPRRPKPQRRRGIPATDFIALIRNSQCFLSLTKIRQNAPKIPQCFLSLTDHVTRKYQSFLSLTKKGGWGLSHSVRTGQITDRLDREHS